MKRKEYIVLGSASLLILTIITVVGIYIFSNLDEITIPGIRENPVYQGEVKIEQFDSEADFREFCCTGVST